MDFGVPVMGAHDCIVLPPQTPPVPIPHTIGNEFLSSDPWNTPPWPREELRRESLPKEAKEGGGREKMWMPMAVPTDEGEKMRMAMAVPHDEEYQLKDALLLNHNNKHDPSLPHMLAALLKACAEQKDLHRGSRIHADIVSSGLLQHYGFLGNAIVSMYAKCGSLAKAQTVFDKLPVRDVVSWSALMAGYAEHGHGERALKCYEQMLFEGFSPNAFTFVCILKACGSIGAAEKGKQIHDAVIREQLLQNNVMVGTALVDMYAKCGLLVKAQEVFDELPVKNLVTWSALIAGYAQHGHGEQAIKCFENMQLEGISPNAITFVCILKACGSIAAADKGRELHADLVKNGLLKQNTVVGTALVDMYGKCNLLKEAQEVFDELEIRNVISWNALMEGYVDHGSSEEALQCFDQMQLEGFLPDTITFVCMFKACGSIGAADKGRGLHARVVKQGLLEKNVAIGNTLVDMYAKCGLLAEAQEVFDELPGRNVVSWNTLITGYAQHGHGMQALKCSEQMQQEGFSPNAVTFVCMLKACATIGATIKGKELHSQIVKEGLLAKNIVVGTALVDMYAKCGLLAKAQEVFDELPVQNVVSWNALVAGYALLGKAQHVFNLFDKMIGGGIKPNLVSLTSLLKVCSHSGLVDKGQKYFQAMSPGYGLIPTLEHHTCMVDLFARAGYLDKAVRVISEMPIAADLMVWLTVLAACRKWGNVDLGRLAFEHAVQLDAKEAAAYVCMMNIYAAAGRQEDADEVEAMRVKAQARKMPGQCWWTDVNGITHSFSIQDKEHPQSKSIYVKLEDLALRMSQEGYSLNLHWMPLNSCSDTTEDLMCSEKWAITYALINTPKGVPIHIVKNMQICGDCHSAISCISKIENCRISLRDTNCFHVFESGNCACGEYC